MEGILRSIIGRYCVVALNRYKLNKVTWMRVKKRFVRQRCELGFQIRNDGDYLGTIMATTNLVTFQNP